nr:hypothetical protein [Cressdnaviricota sp.]
MWHVQIPQLIYYINYSIIETPITFLSGHYKRSGWKCFSSFPNILHPFIKPSVLFLISGGMSETENL